ncbi:MAG TPA: O-antigen ligase family protein [Terriglobales bacterium]|nr:O-antigen ligase family protein [Terriglobales bacterium]
MNTPARKIICWSGIVLFVLGFAYIGLVREIEPIWVLAGLIALPIAVVLVRRYPVVLLAGLLFVGVFKTEPAAGITFKDPTAITLLLLVIAIFVEALFAFTGTMRFSVSDLFRGQWAAAAAYFFFLTVLGVSYLYTPAPDTGGQKLLRFAVFETVAFFAPFFLLKREKDLQKFIWVVLLLTIVLGAKTLLGVFGGTVATTKEGDIADITRIGAGQLIGVTILILLYYKFIESRARHLVLICLPFLAVAMVATVARGPMVSLVLAIFVGMLVLHKSAGLWSRKQIAIGLAVIAVVAAVGLALVAQQRTAQAKFAQKESEFMALLQGSENPGGTAGSRLQFYRVAIGSFAQKPFLGWGLGSWGTIYYGMERQSYPHNIILEIAVEQGVMGLGAFGIFVWLGLQALRRVVRETPKLAFVVPVAAFCFLISMFSGDIGNRAVWFWWGSAFALARMRSLDPTVLPAVAPMSWRRPFGVRPISRIPPDAPVGAFWKG